MPHFAKQRTIVMADDDGEDCALVRDALREAGRSYDLRFVQNGEELFDYLLHQGEYKEGRDVPRPDLILLDLRMPRKDGREVLRELKADPQFRQIPVIALTTSAASDDVSVSYDNGANAYITKPATFRDLVKILDRLSKFWFEVAELPPKRIMVEKRIRILLVEDDPDDVWVMRNLLADRWDTSFELVQVELLSAAIERCNEDKFDVILLDLSLPDSRGLETFFAMHAHTGDVPIVVLSAHNDETSAIRAVQAGAQDYLVKGQVNDSLLLRSIRYAVERGRRHRAEEVMRDTSEEFRAAQEIQQRLYPSEAPTAPGFDIAGSLYPAKATAGDYFDYIPMLDNCWGVVVGDVSSHGMGPALLMSETRACLRTLAQMHSDVGEILTRANRLLAADTSDFHFVTLAMARIDPRDRSMVYASAGQRGYLLRSGIEAVILDSTSLPLGVRADTVVPIAAAISLKPGDLAVFFTDGVVEAESPGMVRFGVARALQIIRSEREKPAKEIIESLHQQLLGFCRSQPPSDDVTIVIVKVTGE